MTREEQIDWLCRLRADLNNGIIFTPWNKEFTEALNDFLEQELKTDGDTISRQAVLDWIKGSVEQYGNEYSGDMINMWMLFEEQITAFPSVESKGG